MVLFCLPCLALLAYFGIASIFFPRYRGYLREGWRCFTDKLRGKKCSVSFDNRMRMAFSAWLTRRGMVRLGRFFNEKRNFDLVMSAFIVGSTILTIYFIVLYIHFLIYPPCDTGSSCSVNA